MKVKSSEWLYIKRVCVCVCVRVSVSVKMFRRVSRDIFRSGIFLPVEFLTILENNTDTIRKYLGMIKNKEKSIQSNEKINEVEWAVNRMKNEVGTEDGTVVGFEVKFKVRYNQNNRDIKLDSIELCNLLRIFGSKPIDGDAMRKLNRLFSLVYGCGSREYTVM